MKPPRKPTLSAPVAADPKFVPGNFARRLIVWQRRHGRHDLPWQNTRDAYRIWLSEIMLQQTQVATVIPYYQAFLARFPDVRALAGAELDEVLRLWSGLGYYSRARNLHRAALQVVTEFGGEFPAAREALQSLPGVGRSTAAAIAAFAFDAREAILDGNVKRVLARHFAVSGAVSSAAVSRQLWQLAESLLPRSGVARYTQALMDLGATVCMRKPDCERCPLRSSCAGLAGGDPRAYPSPRARSARPVRESRFLLIESAGRLLLEKRAPAGLWGGLMCLPECALEENPESVSRARLGCAIRVERELPVLVHAFTHFTLRIHPAICRALSVDVLTDVGGMQWVEFEALGDAAMPTPVRTLVEMAGRWFAESADSRRSTAGRTKGRRAG